MSFGRVAGGHASGNDDPGCAACGVIYRSLCDCGAVKRWVGRDGHAYLGDPAQPVAATHSSDCPCNDRVWGDLRDPEARLLRALRRAGGPSKKSAAERDRRDREYRDAIAKAGIDIGRPLDKPRSAPDSTCPKCGSARSQGRCTAGCDGGSSRPNNIGRGKGTR